MKQRTMGAIDQIIFPGGKTKAFTMSYDDGTIHDRRFVKILNSCGIKATFNLNSGFFGLERKNLNGPLAGLDVSVIGEEEVMPLYEGHEIAGHGFTHAGPTAVGTSYFMNETIRDKAELERITGRLVRGYAYPFGTYNDDVKQVIRLAGYHYARTVVSTGKFDIPADFLEWNATCHHNDPKLMELAESFCKNDAFSMFRKLFYVWGHSYEFAGDNSWDKIEAFCRYMQEHGQDVWFATNGEISDYVRAFRSLEYGAEGGMIYNPSAVPVSFMRDREIFTVRPLETLVL